MSHGQGPPRSTTADVMRAIVALYAAVNDPTKFYIGERYLEQEGAPPRIVLVRGRGKGGGPLQVSSGNVGQWAQSFTAYVWGAEAKPDDDLGRYDAADDMVDRFLNAVSLRVPGRAVVELIDPSVDSNTGTFGEEYRITVTYSRNVPRDGAMFAVPLTPVSPPDPMRPAGDTGRTIVVNPIVEPTR